MNAQRGRDFGSAGLVLALVVGAAALAQEAARPAEGGAAPAVAPAPAPGAPAKKPAVKNLDDLLGLPQDKPAAGAPEDAALPAPEGADAAELDKNRADLERKLTNAELADRFRDAVRQMGESADRIAKGNDIGLVTQRLQEEIIKKLDLIVQQSQNQNSSSSSSSSDQQSNQQKDPGRQQSSRQQGKPSEQNQAGSGENKGEAMPPPGQDPQFKGRLDTARAAWGNLPERVRESLLQGSSDQFSSLYEAMTEAYYRKLAEEAQQ